MWGNPHRLLGYCVVEYIARKGRRKMPRRQQREEPSPDPVDLRVVSPEDPDAWPLLVAFDLE